MKVDKFDVMKNNKKENFSNYAIDLFKYRYQNIVSYDSNELYDEYENECKLKASELGMDIDDLSFDGELIYPNYDDWKNSEKSFYWIYNDDDEFCVYSWK